MTAAPRHFGAILAGGGSRRFGTPKALATLQGRPLVRWVADALAAVCDRVCVVTEDPATIEAAGVEGIADRVADRGPLGGLEAALHWATEQGATGLLLAGCDAPLTTAEAFEAVRGSGSRDRVALGAGRLHPLCAYYRAEALPTVLRHLASDDRSMRALVAALEAEPVDLDARLGPERAKVELVNVNTPDELRAVEDLLR